MNSFRPGGYNVMPSLSQRYYRAGKTTRAMILQDGKKKKKRNLYGFKANLVLDEKFNIFLVILFYWIVPKTSESGLEYIRNSKN